VFSQSSRASDPTNGIAVKISWEYGGEHLSSSNQFYYGFFSTNETSPPLIFFPKGNCLFRLELVDDRGISVPPTELGRTFGSHFLELTRYSPEVIETTVGGSNSGTPLFQRLKNDALTLKALPPPKQLFVIQKPGSYTLRCEFQVFEQVRVGTNFSYSLLRVPRTDVPVVEAK
jgi:hypothetical protein